MISRTGRINHNGSTKKKGRLRGKKKIKAGGKHQNGKSVNENHVNNGKPIKIK